MQITRDIERQIIPANMLHQYLDEIIASNDEDAKLAIALNIIQFRDKIKNESKIKTLEQKIKNLENLFHKPRDNAKNL